jgi:hypothetical protein
MNASHLSMALRNKAADVRNIDATTSKEDDVLRDAADLLRVLAHVVDGKPLAKAFGAPGDWGYGTPIGDAIAAAPEQQAG